MPEIVDDETEQEMEETVLKTKPRLRRSTTVIEPSEEPPHSGARKNAEHFLQ